MYLSSFSKYDIKLFTWAIAKNKDINYSMKEKEGFTLFETVITLLVVILALSYVAFVTGDPLFYYDKHINDLKRLYELKMVMENITHDYVNRCYTNTDFTLHVLRERIGRTNSYVLRRGTEPNFHPYGNVNANDYVKYFVKFNDFVKEMPDSNEKKVYLIRDNRSIHERNMLLVTIQAERESNISLTALFTQKKKQKVQ